MTDSRELALLNLLGVVRRAIANLNLNDPPAALRTLMNGLEEAQPQPLQSAAQEAA